MVSILALWALVLFETVLLVLLLRALGKLRQQGVLSAPQSQTSETWGLDVGVHAPSFIAKDLKGNIIRLDDFQGQRCILTFILPGCSSCADAIHVLRTISPDEAGLVVLIVGGPNGEQNIAYATEQDAHDIPVLTFTPGFDNELYRIKGVPFAFVIDEVGIIRAKGILHEPVHLQHLLAKAFVSVPINR